MDISLLRDPTLIAMLRFTIAVKCNKKGANKIKIVKL
jgi:hypothetical protein